MLNILRIRYVVYDISLCLTTLSTEVNLAFRADYICLHIQSYKIGRGVRNLVLKQNGWMVTFTTHCIETN